MVFRKQCTHICYNVSHYIQAEIQTVADILIQVIVQLGCDWQVHMSECNHTVANLIKRHEDIWHF